MIVPRKTSPSLTSIGVMKGDQYRDSDLQKNVQKNGQNITENHHFWVVPWRATNENQKNFQGVTMIQNQGVMIGEDSSRIQNEIQGELSVVLELTGRNGNRNKK
eukprot:Trichotokara_eunicae@DN6929_c0_g1_i1.p1